MEFEFVFEIIVMVGSRIELVFLHGLEFLTDDLRLMVRLGGIFDVLCN